MKNTIVNEIILKMQSVLNARQVYFMCYFFVFLDYFGIPF